MWGKQDSIFFYKTSFKPKIHKQEHLTNNQPNIFFKQKKLTNIQQIFSISKEHLTKTITSN